MLKRLKGIGLLLISNILIFLTLSFVFNLLVNVILPAFGVDLRGAVNQQDLLWALVIGFGGAFHQFGVFQTDGQGHAGLLSDYPATHAAGARDLRLRTGNRPASAHQHAGGLGI